MKTLIRLLPSLLLVVSFGCKSKSKGGSTVAVVPPAAQVSCAGYINRGGIYYDANNQVVACTPDNLQNTCNGYNFDVTRNTWVDAANNPVVCNSGIYNNGVNGQFYPFYHSFGSGCEAYNNRGIYVPVMIGPSLVCMGYDYISYSFNGSYLNQIYPGGTWISGNPVLYSCRVGTADCNCGDTLWGTLQWCWARY